MELTRTQLIFITAKGTNNLFTFFDWAGEVDCLGSGVSVHEMFGRTAIFAIEAMERLRIDIARHANKNGCVRSHDQEVFEGKTTLEGS
jgi:hypothetical protein